MNNNTQTRKRQVGQIAKMLYWISPDTNWFRFVGMLLKHYPSEYLFQMIPAINQKKLATLEEDRAKPYILVVLRNRYPEWRAANEKEQLNKDFAELEKRIHIKTQSIEEQWILDARKRYRILKQTLNHANGAFRRDIIQEMNSIQNRFFSHGIELEVQKHEINYSY